MNTIAIIGVSKEISDDISSILKSEGFDNIQLFETAKIFKDTLNRQEEEHVSGDDKTGLIIMDIRTGRGFESCRELSVFKITSDIPIIAIIEDIEEETIKQAFDGGAVEILSCPINKYQLIVRVSTTLKLRNETVKNKDLVEKLFQARESILKGEYRVYQIQQELDDARKELRKISTMDGLTGITNRQGYDEFADIEWKRSIRESVPISLLIVDIDYFKRYNDTYGHQQGDKCLIKVANALSDSLNRPADLVARYGGEEFVVLLPNTEYEGAVMVAEKLREKIMNLKIPHKSSDVSDNITISIGVVAVLPDRNSKYRCFFAIADEAMYAAKDSGRNTVKTAESINDENGD